VSQADIAAVAAPTRAERPQLSLMRAVGVFLALTVAISAVFWALMIASGHVLGAKGAYAIGLEWSPGAAALLTCAILRIDLATLGWSWRPWRWPVLAYATAFAVCAVTYGLVWATGLGGFPNLKTVTGLRDALGLGGLATPVVLLAWAPLWLLLSVRVAASALGEGIGWSGFLAPRLATRFGFTGAALILGVIWASWHVPILLYSDYFDSSSPPLWFALPSFAAQILGLSVIVLWLRLRSGSLWTGALVNTGINVFNDFVFSPLTAPHGRITAFAIDKSGFMLPLVIAATALLFWLRRRDVDQPPGPAQP
jgi:membrane protease YdiL (CAAX protease family)